MHRRVAGMHWTGRARRATAVVAALLVSSGIAPASLDAAPFGDAGRTLEDADAGLVGTGGTASDDELAAIAVQQVATATDVDLVFASTRDGGGVLDLWTIDASGALQLLDLVGEDTFPQFSPDGSRIAWSKDGGNTTNGRLWLADADGSGAAVANSFQTRFAPAWSPDGTQIAVIGVTGDADFDLHLVAADGSGAAKLADTSANETNPTWGTFGIALVRGSSIVLVDPSTGADITAFAVGPSASTLDAHPTEPLIAFSQPVVDGRRIVVLDVGTGVVTPLTDGTTYDSAPSWSPDGSAIAFGRATTLGGDADLWVMDADATNAVAVTSGGGNDVTPDWRPTAAPPDPALVAVEPSWGAPGSWTIMSSTADATGRCGFPPDTELQISWDDTPLATVTTDTDGCFREHVFLDPERLTGSPLGTHAMTVDAPDGSTGTADFEQVAEELLVRPIVAGPGAPIAVEGCGWTPRSEVVIVWYATGQALGTVLTDEAGCLAGSVDLPVASAGLYPIAAAPAGTKPTGPGGTSATAIEIAPAAFVLSPSSGPPGARAAVIGCGWFAGELVDFVWLSTGESLGTFGADGRGCLFSDVADPDFGTLAWISIPADAAEGSHLVLASGATSGQEHDETFTVVVPELVFDPASAAPGEIVAVSGCGWNGNDTVTITWGAVDPNDSNPAWLAPVDQVTGCFGAAGGFTIEIPDNTRTGEITVTAAGDERGTATAVFEVVHTGTITAPPTAQVGETITVQISDAIIGETIEISVNGFYTAGFASATTTDFATDVTIPLDSPVGDVRLVADGTRGFSAETPITIPNPSRVEVVSAEPIFSGRRFRIDGSGFVPDSFVTIGLSDDPAIFGSFESVHVDPGSTSFSATLTVPADRASGTHELSWSGVSRRNGSIDVEVDVPPFDVVADEAVVPGIDGVITDDEWDLTNAVQLGSAQVAFQSDDVRLYVLVDVLGDDTTDIGDAAALLVDVDGDGAPTPGIDRRFRIEADGRFVVETFNIDGSYAPVSSLSRSAGATSVDCFSADGSLAIDASTGNTTCDAHRAYEFAVDLDGIVAEPDDHVLIGVEIDSTTPAIGDSFPRLLPATMHGLGRVRLAPSQFTSPLPTGTVQGIGIDGFEIEVTQAVQDESGSVNLVADKPTAVRVYPDTVGDAVVVVRLFGERDGSPLPGSPLAVAMIVPDAPDRERIEDSANFRLPASWTEAGSVLLRASVNELDGIGTVFETTGVTFQERRVPDIWYVPLNTGTTSSPTLIDQPTIDTQLSYFETALPVAGVDWTVQPWTVIGANVPTTTNSSGNTVTDLDEANKLLNGYFLDLVAAYSTSIANGSPAPFEPPTYLYGFAPSGGGLADATWAGGGGVSASGFWGTSREGTMAHEINHLLDQSETGTWGLHVTDDDDDTSNSSWGCRAKGGDPNWPRRAQADDEIGIIGFDTRAPWHDSSNTTDKTVIPADIADFMSYCQSGYIPTKWISPYRWERIFVAMTPPSSPIRVQSLRASTTTSIGAAELSASDVGPAYYISGEIRADGTGSLDPVIRQWGIGTDRLSTGSHRIVLFDAAGAVVDIVELAPTFVDVEGNARDVVFFQAVVPTGADVAVVELVGPQGTLDRIEASANPPTLELPVLDGSWTGTRELSWSAADADGDPLTFSVRYSPDGDRWYPVASGLTTSSIMIDGASLVGGTAGRFSVTATDGLNTTAAITGGSFSVDPSPPTVQIVTPLATDAPVPGEEVIASGFAHDQFGARVDEDRLVWLVDGVPVGRGRSVRFRAPAEEYQLELVVVDGSGAVVATETTQVGGEVNLPPSITSAPTTQTTELSDAIVPITIVATDPDGDQLALEVTDVPSGLESGPVECSPSADGTSCRIVLSGVPTGPVGSYDVTVTADDGSTSVATTFTIVVVPEAATVRLHPANPVAVGADGGVSEPFGLTVRVAELAPDVAEGTPLPADITNADVTLVVEPLAGGSAVPPDECERRSDDAELIVTCLFDGVPVGAYAVVARAGGAFRGGSEDVLVVSEPGAATVSGGGAFVWPGSQDTVRVAMSIETTKKGTSVRGGFAVVRTSPDGVQHIVRSNAIQALGPSDASASADAASITGKATYFDPSVGEFVGNHQFTVWVEDVSDGPDRVWLRVLDKDGAPVDALSMPVPASGHAVAIDGDLVVSLDAPLPPRLR